MRLNSTVLTLLARAHLWNRTNILLVNHHFHLHQNANAKKKCGEKNTATGGGKGKKAENCEVTRNCVGASVSARRAKLKCRRLQQNLCANVTSLGARADCSKEQNQPSDVHSVALMNCEQSERARKLLSNGATKISEEEEEEEDGGEKRVENEH